MKYKLKEIGTVITGVTPKTKNENYYNNNDFLFIGPTDLKKGKYVKKSEKYISNTAYQDYTNRFIGKNSIMIDCIGSDMGNVALSNNIVLTNQQINSITNIDENIFNVEYVYYLLSTMKRYFHQIGTNGSTMPIINKSMFEEIEIDIPNKIYQDKVAKILSRIDLKIDNNVYTNNNLLEIGLSLVNKYFEEEQINILFGNAIKFVKGKKPKDISNSKQDNYEKYLTIACLNNQELNYADTNKMIIAENDLLMVMDGASSGDIYYSDYGIVGSTLAKIDIIDERFNKGYIYFCLKKLNDIIKTKNTGSAIPHTDKVFVGSLEIPEVDVSKQKSFIILLSKIQKNEKENQVLQQLRDTLLPKLMNGEIDLNKVEI